MRRMHLRSDRHTRDTAVVPIAIPKLFVGVSGAVAL